MRPASVFSALSIRNYVYQEFLVLICFRQIIQAAISVKIFYKNKKGW